MKPIPVVDIFAGPGGLGEGFASVTDQNENRIFDVALSIEKDPYAWQTLFLRSFFRQFPVGKVPAEYYSFLRSEIKSEQLYSSFPGESERTKKVVWLAELGKEPSENVDQKIREATYGSDDWVLIGGPPCQPYSLAGKSGRGGLNPEDPKVYLYREYYRILAVHSPPVFVMENVKGLLSAKLNEQRIISQILADISDPVAAYSKLNGNQATRLSCPGYRIYSLVSPAKHELDGRISHAPDSLIIKCEDFGIPQTRHRLILLGIRADIETVPSLLVEREHVNTEKVLKGLPRLRSGLSEEPDSPERWKATLTTLLSNGLIQDCDADVVAEIRKSILNLRLPQHDKGREFIPAEVSASYRPEWYLDSLLGGVCNHSSRLHMTTDLYRYMFAACFAKVHGKSPRLSDFPAYLLPDHKSVGENPSRSGFADRFRVHLWNEPARTVTSHMARDGHYYIHPDPTQCRSMTVREAARLQTFPDNYYFCGPRTSQYIQVGNAVPPLLAQQIAEIVSGVFAGLPSVGHVNSAAVSI